MNMAGFYCSKKSSSVRAAAKQHMAKGLDLNLPPTLYVEIICRAATEIILMTSFTPVSSSDNFWMPRINRLTASPCQAGPPSSLVSPLYIYVASLSGRSAERVHAFTLLHASLPICVSGDEVGETPLRRWKKAVGKAAEGKKRVFFVCVWGGGGIVRVTPPGS